LTIIMTTSTLPSSSNKTRPGLGKTLNYYPLPPSVPTVQL
jgi:hypothetical protein